MFEDAKNGLTARAWLSSSFFLVLAFTTACTHNRSLTIGAPEAIPAEDALAQIKERATDSLSVEESGFAIKVHYGTREEGRAHEAAQLLRFPIVFVTERTGLKAHGRVEAYLYALQPGEDPPHFEARGRGDFTLVFFMSDAEPLLENAYNRLWYDTFTHELVHSFLGSLPLRDRWVEDGLAEYLQAEFSKVYQPELPTGKASFPTTSDWLPPLEALQRVTWEPWSHVETRRLLKIRKKDPELAAYFLNQEVWKYSAAGELLKRWMEAAGRAGIDEPVRDLVRRLRSQGGRVNSDVTRRLIRAQTGQAFEELVKVTDQDVKAARRWAWQNRLSSVYAERVRALRVLTFFGLPAGVACKELLAAFELPEFTPDGPYVEQTLALATTGALASGGDAGAAAAALELLRQRQGEELPLYVAPELLGLVAELDEQKVVGELVSIMIEPRVGLGIRERANEILEKLTEETTGWSVELSFTERKRAAAEWTRVTRTAP